MLFSDYFLLLLVGKMPCGHLAVSQEALEIVELEMGISIIGLNTSFLKPVLSLIFNSSFIPRQGIAYRNSRWGLSSVLHRSRDPKHLWQINEMQLPGENKDRESWVMGPWRNCIACFETSRLHPSERGH